MILQTETTTTKKIIYQYGEGTKAAKEVNVLKKLHKFKCTDWEKATKETAGYYVMQHTETESEGSIK